ncbi:uncharacterized protein METZ01_LOCUS275076, partial [marine metagenome]
MFRNQACLPIKANLGANTLSNARLIFS